MILYFERYFEKWYIEERSPFTLIAKIWKWISIWISSCYEMLQL
jgi:hypothetical protein